MGMIRRTTESWDRTAFVAVAAALLAAEVAADDPDWSRERRSPAGAGLS
jgi:hypothetical protein